MLPLLLSHVFFHQEPTTKLVLENGIAVGKKLPASAAGVGTVDRPISRYWGTSDTYLDSTEPLQNNGDSHVLEGGPGRTILIKFGDLERFGRKKVVKATLFLTPSVEGKPRLSSIRTVSVPWGEGPLRRPFFTDKPLIAEDWSATWKSRHSGVDGMDWQQNGAAGPGDSTVINGALLSDDGKEIAISGLEGAVQNMMDRWYQNEGFAIMFSAPTEFFSAKNVTGKPRLELELADAPTSAGPDLSVSLIEAKYDDANANPPVIWPRDGTGVTYIAHIKNVGDVATNGFQGAWNIGEKLGSGFEITKKLSPGEETTVEIKRPFKANTTDHRHQPLGFLIKPQGSDANASNDYLEIQEDAIPIPVSVPKTSPEHKEFSEDSAQAQFRHLNDGVLAESKFSFAPEGALERFRIASFSDADAVHVFAPGDGDDLRLILQQVGMMPYDHMQPNINELEGQKMIRESKDRWPGLLMGGCSANDISVPGEIQLPYEANYNEVFDQYELQPSGLLAATDVATLNNNLGKSAPSLKPIGKLPGTIILRAMNRDGEVLPNTELRFYQSDGTAGVSKDATFRLVTSDSGTVLLPLRVGPGGKTDQYGGLATDGSNGVYLIAATRNGVTDTAWLKAWQLADSLSRTGKQAIFTELRFNVPYMEVDRTTNLAVGSTFSDSGKQDSAKLATIAGENAPDVRLPNKAGDWIEIDLGKEQQISEIDVVANRGEFWKRFDILTYFGGEKIDQASPYAHEIDWDWNWDVRPEMDGASRYLAYRGSGKSVRYIRIVCREASTSGTASALIRVFGSKA